MKNLSTGPLTLLLGSLVLSACSGNGGTPVAPTVASLTLTGSSTLQIDAPTPLAAVARDASGNVISSAAISYSSSDPSVVSLDATGKATAHKFNVGAVTLTATSGSQNATLNVATYGLEVTGGTYNDVATSKLGTSLLVRFRQADQTTLNTASPVSLTGPSGYNGGQVYTLGGTLKTNAGNSLGLTVNDNQTAPVTGAYMASTVVNGITYTSAFTIDAAKTLAPLATAAVTLTATGDTISGTPSADTKAFRLFTYNSATDSSVFFSLHPVTDLPFSGTFSTPLASGSYDTYVLTYNYLLGNAEVAPAQFNTARVATGTKTF